MKGSTDVSVEFASYNSEDINNVLKFFDAETEDPSKCILSTIKAGINIERILTTLNEDNSVVTLRCKTEYMLSKQELDAYYTKMRSRVLDVLSETHIHGQGRLLVKTSRLDSRSADGKFSGKTHFIGKSI